MIENLCLAEGTRRCWPALPCWSLLTLQTYGNKKDVGVMSLSALIPDDRL